MIDVLSGAVTLAQADAALMALFPAGAQTIYLDQSPEGMKVYPRAVIRHVRTTWKRSKNAAGTITRDDITTFKFLVHGDNLPVLNQIQTRLQALFDTGQPFALMGSDGSPVATATAAMASCLEESGGSFESLPQPSQTNLSIHRLDIRFRCEVTRHR
jgi:hypothetical protein